MRKRTEATTTSKTGIYFCGIVEERRKRLVPKEAPTTEVVTYSFYDDELRKNYYVDDYSPDKYFEVGEYIEVPVRIKPYINRTTNRPAYSMTIRNSSGRSGDSSNGEVF